MKNILNPKKWLSEPRNVLGIMTGTSVDSIDLSLVKITKIKSQFLFEYLCFESFKFSDSTKKMIHLAASDKLSSSTLSQLNFQLSREYADSINKFRRIIKDSTTKIDCIGLHGQTIWHEPPSNSLHPSSWQIGSGSIVSNLVHLSVVSDFRVADVALGGEGAPLVPIFDYFSLRNQKHDVIALNIGGISNITYIPQKSKLNEIIAFDTGPGNALIDEFMRKQFGKEFDNEGAIAKKGHLNKELFNKLKNIEFVRKKPPKSTGKEFFNLENIENIINDNFSNYPANDVLHTLTRFTTWAVSWNIKKYCTDKCIIACSGGGTKNLLLMQMLRDELSKAKVLLTDELGVPSASKEASCFAFLAFRTLGGLTSNLPKVTGAKRKAILGAISLP